ncbi:hypothetical protein NLI96_g6620 [Meripilus lineatus]|uniref:F-box domain-containing protein n=1 Tax=Meripilus lineatus TaxID=2056292 RepID=A0AAD5V186_9APHY|nr:hypothetical protein NLI96_g6620 [Physisporinus lineatus]
METNIDSDRDTESIWDTRSSSYSSSPSVQFLPHQIPIPWDIQHYIIDFVAYPQVMFDEDNNVVDDLGPDPFEWPERGPISIIKDRIGVCQTLRSCSLVCRGWATVSQELMFQWICLSNCQQTDKLYTVLRDPQSSHLSQTIRRLSIVYRHPYQRIGEAIPRIIGMGLSRLDCLDMCAGRGRDAAKYDFPMFPFHPSLRARLSHLNQIRILHLHNFRFSHFAEFRRIVCGFSGVHHLVAIHVKFGADRLGDSRPIHRSKEWQIPTKVSWQWGEAEGDWMREEDRNVEVDTPSILWIANIPNLHQAIKKPSSETTCPVLTPQVADAIIHINQYDRVEVRSLERWQWRCEASRSGLGQDWTLSSVSSDDQTLNRYFRFRVGSNNPQDVPLGFEHFIETRIPHKIYEPRYLPSFLRKTSEKLQECFEGLITAKVTLAFLTNPWIPPSPSESRPAPMPKDSKQNLYAAIVAITEEFIRSQTDVDLNFTIDGLSPEELYLFINRVHTNELLWPIQVPIPWDIQRHIIESVPSFVFDDGKLVFDDLTHNGAAESEPISATRDHAVACQTLRNCSLVCRRWATVSRKLIFLWVCLSHHQNMDRLYAILRDPQSSHLSQNVRRLSVLFDQYRPERVGGVIPRIIGMRLSRLEYLDLCAGNDTYPTFPFHPSLRAQLSQLDQIRILHLHNFHFSHLAEFRRFVGAFSGIRHLIAIYVKFGEDKLGDFRSIHHSKKWQMPEEVSWKYTQWPDPYPSVLWMADIPNPHQVAETSSSKNTYPILSRHLTNAIMHSEYYYSRYIWRDYPLNWRWRCEEGGTGGPGRSWFLFCISPHKVLCPYFRFHVGPEHSRHVPLGLEHLKEVCIPRMTKIDMRKLRLSLIQTFQTWQEHFGGFLNVEKVKLALLTRPTIWEVDAISWRLQSEERRRKRREEYIAIIAITEEFIRSQTRFDMDFTIDGLPPEELHLLISSVQTNELLRPIQNPIPWNIQRHIIEFVPCFQVVPTDGTRSVLAFDDLSHSRASESKPISTIRAQVEALQALRTCSLVCQQWATVSQKLIFVWVCLSHHKQTDKLYALLRDPQSSHLSQDVRRLTIVYRHPYEDYGNYEKVGEVIPRIIGMGLSRLEYLDLCAGDNDYGIDYPIFPFHPSLRAQLSQLNQVRVLHLHNFRFAHLAEFRQFVGAFSGIHHLIAIFVKFGEDKRGDYRPIHQTRKWKMPTAVSWGDNEPTEDSPHEFYSPSILWVANIPNPHGVVKTSSTKIHTPTLTLDLAYAIMGTIHYFAGCPGPAPSYFQLPLITWHWQRGEGAAGGPSQDWTLFCVSSFGEYHYFRFRMGSDNPTDIPLGFEHLIELCIPHLVEEPQELPFSLRWQFQESQERFGGFPNVERVKLALLVSGKVDGTPGGSRSEKTERRLLKRYIPIIDEFRCSQTDFDLDITIDGAPLEELRRFISVPEESYDSDDGDSYYLGSLFDHLDD